MALMLSASLSFSQTSSSTIIPDGGGNNASDIQNINSRSGMWIQSTKSNNYEGTFYLFENWIYKAEVFDIKGKGYDLPNCNFNVKSNRLEALIENDIDDKNGKIFAFNSADLSKFRIGQKLFVKKNTNKGANSMVELIQQGPKVSLYKYYNTTIKTTRINPMTQQKMGRDKIILSPTYFTESEGVMTEVKLKKSAILKIMASNKSEVKSFIKENKLNINEDEDVSKVFKYYNSL